MAVGSVTIGNLVVHIGVDDSNLADGIKKVNTQTNNFNSSIAGVITSLTKWATAAAITGATMALWFIHKSAEMIDEQSKLARQLGGTTEAVQALTHVAALAGVSSGELRTSMQALNQRLGEAARTAEGPAYEALKRLGLSAKELSKMDADERLATVADRIKTMGMSSQSAADTMRNLGIRSREMLSVIEDGGDAIREAKEELRQLGATVSDVDARKIEEANDAWTRVKAALTGIANQVVIRLSDYIRMLGEYFVDAAKEGKGFGDQVDAAVQFVVRAFVQLRIEIYHARVAFDELGALALNVLDGIAGAIPRAIAAMSGGLVTTAQLGFKTLEHDWGKLREKLGEPPSMAAYDAYFATMKAKYDQKAKEDVARDEERKKNVDNMAKVMTEKEIKEYEDKLLRLRGAIANEDEALRVQREKQLKDLDELFKKGRMKREEFNKIKEQIEDKHQDKMRELIQSKLEQGILNEDEIMARKFREQLKKIQEFEEAHTITKQKAEELRLKHAEKYKLDMIQLYASQASSLASIVDTSLGHISSIMGDEGKKQFTIMKGLAMATALVKGVEATIGAYAAGNKIGGPIVGAVFAGIAAAGAAAYIAKLAGIGPKQTGGSVNAGQPYMVGETGRELFVPSTNGKIIPSGVVNQMGNNASRTLTIEMHGERWSSAQVRELMERINEEQRDGTVLLRMK